MYKNKVQKSYVVKSLLIEQENKTSVWQFFSEPAKVLYTPMWTTSLEHILFI